MWATEDSTDGIAPERVIDLELVASEFYGPDERPIHRRVWYLLRMKKWREDWRRAQDEKDYYRMDRLDQEYELINGI